MQKNNAAYESLLRGGSAVNAGTTSNLQIMIHKSMLKRLATSKDHLASVSAPVIRKASGIDRPVDEDVEVCLKDFETLVRAVLHREPPVITTRDKDWLMLFRYCESNRETLAMRMWQARRGAPASIADLWLKELASAPGGKYFYIRSQIRMLIARCGIPPRGQGQPLFSTETSGLS